MENAGKVASRAKGGAVRDSNYELLRILAMAFITAVHCWHGLAGIHPSEFTPVNYFFHRLFCAFGQTGVILFMMISGFFLCRSRFKVRSFLRIAFQVLFVSSLLLVLHRILFPEDRWTAGRIAGYLLLLGHGDFWFVWPYLITCLLSPLLNLVISRLDKSRYLFLLVIAGVFISVLPSLTQNYNWSNGPFANLPLFLFVYFLGAYFRLFAQETQGREKMFRAEVLLLFGVFIALILVFCFVQERYNYVNYFCCRTNFVTILFAVLLFLVFKQAKIRPNKVINAIGGSTFGIYLLHENFMTRAALWSGVFHVDAYIKSPAFIPYLIGVVALVFVLCLLVDLVRKYLFEKPFFSFLNKVCGKGLDKLDSLIPFGNLAAPAEDVKVPHFWLHVLYTAMAITIAAVLPYNAPLFFLSEMTVYLMAACVVRRIRQVEVGRMLLPPYRAI